MCSISRNSRITSSQLRRPPCRDGDRYSRIVDAPQLTEISRSTCQFKMASVFSRSQHNHQLCKHLQLQHPPEHAIIILRIGTNVSGMSAKLQFSNSVIEWRVLP